MSRIRRWGWRILIGLVVLSALFMAARITLRIVADRRLEAEVARVRETGEPLTLAEIEQPSIPDAENAAEVYERVFTLLVSEDDVWEDDEDAGFELSRARDVLGDDPLALDDEAAAILQHWLGANAEALALLPEALERPECQFEMLWPELRIEFQWPAVEPVQQIGELLRIRAMAAFRRGDLDAALDAVTLGVRVADQAMQPQAMITVLVRASVQSELLRVMERALGEGVPSRAALERLDAAVEAVDRHRVLQRTFVFERAYGGSGYAMALEESGLSDSPGLLEELDPSNSLLNRMLGDLLFRLDHARYLRLVRRALVLAERPYFETRDAWQRLWDEATEGPGHAVFSRLLSVVWLRLVRNWAHHEARLDVTRLGLRVERHRLEHGALPRRLEDLDADASALLDPFSGEPYRYRPSDDGSYVVYGVGEDGVDDGGVEDEDDSGVPDIAFRVPVRD